MFNWLQKWWKRETKTIHKTKRTKRKFRPEIELLDIRVTPSVTGFVNNPTTNSVDWSNYVTGLGGIIDSSVNFDSHPTGSLQSNFYAGDGVTLTAVGDDNTVEFGAGPGQGNTSEQPLSPGEGLHAASNFLADGQNSSTLTISFATPVFGAGLFVVDYFNPGNNNPITIEAFSSPNGTGTSLGKFTSVADNFQPNNIYFMGVASDTANIRSLVYAGPRNLGDITGIDDIRFATEPHPIVAADHPSVTVNEGNSAINSGTFGDTDSAKMVTLSATVGTITPSGTNSGTWTWSYTPAEPAQSQTVTITANDGSHSVTTSFALNVNDAPLTDATTPATLNPVEGNSTGSQIVATFTDANPDAQAADFPAQNLVINWGDNGPASNGTIQFVSSIGGVSTWNVLGSHVYAEPGTYSVNVAITDVDGSTLTTTSGVTLDVTPPNGRPSEPGFTEGPDTRAVTVTFASTTAITGLEWKAKLAVGQTFAARIYDDSTGALLASGTASAGTGAESYMTSPISFTFQANKAYRVGIYWTDTNAVVPYFSDPSLPYTVGNATFSHLWANFGDVFPASGNSFEMLFKFDSAGITFNVADAPLTNNTAAATLNAVEGNSTDSQVVATFTDGNPNATQGDFSAMIDWGDHTSTPGTISATAAGPLAPLSLSGFNQDVVYEAGTSTPAVSTPFDGGAYSWFQSGAQDVFGHTHPDGLPTSFTSNAGTPFQFQPFNADNALLLSSATPTGTLTLTTPSDYNALAILAAGSFGGGTGTVVLNFADGSHSAPLNYTAPDWWSGKFAAGYALPNNAGSAAATTGGFSFDVHPDGTQMYETDLNLATLGLNTKAIASLTFTNAGINSAHTGIFAVSGSSQAFTVSGSHTYQEKGNYQVSAAITDKDGSTLTTSGVSFNVADAALTDATSTQTLHAVEGNTTGSQVIATFTDQNLNATMDDFPSSNLVIDWGDSSPTSNGTIQLVSRTGGVSTWNVLGSHAYGEKGNYNVSVKVSDVDGSVLAGTSGVKFSVADAFLTEASATHIFNAVEGNSTGSQIVATFTDGNPLASAADFPDANLVITWGDGGPTGLGTLQFVSSNATSSTWNVLGSHVYAEKGSYKVSVKITDVDGSSLSSANHTKDYVTDAPLTNATIAHTSNVVVGNATGSQTVATFTDGNPNAPASDFPSSKLLITWGDHGPTSSGALQLVSRDGGVSTWNVLGSHVYLKKGIYHVSVKVTDVDGSVLPAATGTAFNVLPATLTDTTPTRTYSALGNMNTGWVSVATFSSNNPLMLATEFPTNRVLINWGDGTSSFGIVQLVSRTATTSNWRVAGNHTYKNPLLDKTVYTVTVTVTDLDDMSFTTSNTKFSVTKRRGW